MYRALLSSRLDPSMTRQAAISCSWLNSRQNKEIGFVQVERGGQEGNQNAGKAKLVYGALLRASTQEDHQRIRLAAEKVLELAATGDKWACEFVRDTLDGKPKQQTEVTGADGAGLVIQVLQYTKPVADSDPS